MLTLFILNLRIIYEIRRARSDQSNLQAHVFQRPSLVSRDEIKVTMMLVGVVIVFGICHCPYAILT